MNLLSKNSRPSLTQTVICSASKIFLTLRETVSLESWKQPKKLKEVTRTVGRMFLRPSKPLWSPSGKNFNGSSSLRTTFRASQKSKKVSPKRK
jgi:hypothetical protein